MIKKLLIVLIFSLSGCVTSVYETRPEIVYIPPIERPIRLYRYDNFWYAEPYIYLTFEDSTGYRTRKKIPTSRLRKHMERKRPIMRNKKDVDSIIKDVNKMKQHQNRIKNKRRMRKRK